MRRLGATWLALAAVWAAAAPSAHAEAPYILNGMYLALDGGVHSNTINGGIWHWQQRSFAVLNTYGGDPAQIVGEMRDIWDNQNSVPMVSYAPPTPNSVAAAGGYDQTVYMPFVAVVRDFLSGPDGQLGNWDDRRAYMRFGWEPNIEQSGWSPCRVTNRESATPAQDYIASWRRLHDMFRAAGVDRTRLAWVFSVASGDHCTQGKPENVYPGSAYVDWLGMNVYAPCGGSPSDNMTTTMNRLRAIAPGKPVGVNEAGVSSYRGIAAKNAWIAGYWSFLRANDIRMSIWFNSDKGSSTSCAEFEKPWAVFGLNHGDESRLDPFTGITWKGFSAYRLAVGEPWVIGNNGSARRLTDQHFLGL